jgi:uncharacterized protein YcgI (DUF1989 family)
MTLPAAVPGDVVSDRIIPAREYLGLELRRGQTMRIVDVEGKQVPDFVCFNLANPRERLSTNNSRLIQKRWLLTTGHALYSDEGNVMLRITDDTVGVHHASAGCCNDFANFLRYGERGTRNCLDNMTLAAAPLGLTTKDIPGAFCPFMKVIQHPDGAYEIQEPDSRAGDHIDLRAEMDLFVAISNCPQDKNPCNGFNPTALRVIVFDQSGR